LVDTVEEPKHERLDAGLEPAPFIFVVMECERPVVGGSRHLLAGVREVLIGRGEAREVIRDGARLVLRFASPWLSATHARLVADRDTWRFEDLGSTNGCSVDGERIPTRSGTGVVVGEANALEAGRVIFVVRDGLPSRPGVEPDLGPLGAGCERPGLETLLPALGDELAGLRAAARATLPILLVGETGTGKEIVSRAIHDLSGRGGAFVAVNCGALAATLADSQLFGHVKGAFTGAVRDQPGLIRAAHGGTLLLDEVGDLRPDLQVMLLRVLQEGEVLPVGSTRSEPVDVRVLAATHQPLWELERAGTFRGDLLARLDGVRFRLPPLRERREDLGMVVAALLERELGPAASEVSLTVPAALSLLAHTWPFNVRELQQAIRRALTLRRRRALAAEDLQLRPSWPDAGLARRASREAAEPGAGDGRLRDGLLQRLSATGGNVAEVARSYGKARFQVHRWMGRFGIDPKEFRRPRKRS
jgi:transcriptional regulator with AAA-type ATPase domain